MRTVSLLDEPVYETISYDWGDPNVTTAITVDDTQIRVTSNLAKALRRFRARDAAYPRAWLWADAICIDQTNDVERAQQVTMMGEIFEAAEQLRVWIGDCTNNEDTDDELAARAMLFTASFGRLLADPVALRQRCDDIRLRGLVDFQQDADALSHLFTCSYWSRTW